MNNSLMKFNPETYDALVERAEVLCKTGLVPKHLRNKPEDCLLLMLMGAQRGIDPQTALSAFIVINGKVCMPAATLLGLVTAHPDYHWHTISSLQEFRESGIAVMKIKRKSWPDNVVQEYTFSHEDAKEAGLANSSPTWKRYFGDMCTARVKGRGCAGAFPELLLGIQLSEAQQDAGFKDEPAKPEVMVSRKNPKPSPMVAVVDAACDEDEGPIALPEPSIDRHLDRVAAITAEPAAEPTAMEINPKTGKTRRKRRTKAELEAAGYYGEKPAAEPFNAVNDEGNRYMVESPAELNADDESPEMQAEFDKAEAKIQAEAKAAGVELYPLDDTPAPSQNMTNPPSLVADTTVQRKGWQL